MGRGILALALLLGCGVEPPPEAPGAVVFLADPPELRLGESAVLSWDAGEATAVRLFEEGRPIAEAGELPPRGSWRVQPEKTTRYQLRATGKDGVALEGSLMLTVRSGVHVAAFQADPRWVLPGQASQLRWSVRGVERITLLEADGILALREGAEALEGALAVRPMHTTTYTLIAEGVDGTEEEVQATVVVDPPPTVELLASPRRIFVGDSAVLSWAFSDATSIRISEANGTELHRSTEPIGFLAVQPEASTSYRALAVGHGGASEAWVQVEVLPVIERFRVVGVKGHGAERRAILAWQTTGADELHLTNLEGWEVSLTAKGEGRVYAPLGEARTFRLTARTRKGAIQEATLEIEDEG